MENSMLRKIKFDSVAHLGYTLNRQVKKEVIKMSKTAMVRARIEPKLKNKVEQIFEALGLTTSEVINLFYHRVKLENGLPFDLKIPNSKTVYAMKDVEMKRNLHSHRDAEDMLKSLKK